MRVLHLLAGGEIGGIEMLCKDYAMFSQHHNIILLPWEGGTLAIEMRKKGISVIELNEKKNSIISTAKKIVDICREESIDTVVVHHASPKAHLFLMKIKRKYPNIKTIVYAHGDAKDMCRYKEKKGLLIRKKIVCKSMEKADSIIAISKYVKNSIIEYFGISESKIIVVYNGVDLNRFGQKYTDNSTIKIIYIGRLIEEKGVHITLEALAHLPKSLDYKFYIVGDGNYRSILEKKTISLGLRDKVVFMGSRNDVPELLQSSDIFIHMPVWEEGFGITIVEAMASRLLCICAESGAIPEIIDDRNNGFLVKKDDYIMLQQTIKYVLNNINSGNMDQIRARAQEDAKSFSIENYAKRMDLIVSK